jgi:hypothetical protein
MAGPDTDLATSVARILYRMAEVADKAPSGALGRDARIVAGLTPETLLDRSRRQLNAQLRKAELEAAHTFHDVDATLRLALRSNHTAEWVFSVLNASGMLRQASFARWLSMEDRVAMIADLAEKLRSLSLRAHLYPDELLRMATQGGYVNTLAGSMRELYGRNLQPIRRATLDCLVDIDDARRLRPQLEIVDSRILGSVELPTRLRKGERGVALGSDRLVASGLRRPQIVREVDDAGGTFEIAVTGVLDQVQIVAEVKGRTTATGALDQFVKLNQRGSGGYVVIGDSLWIMPRFDPRKARFFAVAPEGQFLLDAERQAKALRSLGYSIDVLPIEAAVDQEIYAVARELIADYVKLATSLVP